MYAQAMRNERIKCIEFTRANKTSICCLKKHTTNKKMVAAIFRCWVLTLRWNRTHDVKRLWKPLQRGRKTKQMVTSWILLHIWIQYTYEMYTFGVCVSPAQDDTKFFTICFLLPNPALFPTKLSLQTHPSTSQLIQWICHTASHFSNLK